MNRFQQKINKMSFSQLKGTLLEIYEAKRSNRYKYNLDVVHDLERKETKVNFVMQEMRKINLKNKDYLEWLQKEQNKASKIYIKK